MNNFDTIRPCFVISNDHLNKIRNIERTLMLCNTYITNSVRQKKTNLKSTTESVIDKLKLKIGDNNSKLIAVIRDIEQNVKNHLTFHLFNFSTKNKYKTNNAKD